MRVVELCKFITKTEPFPLLWRATHSLQSMITLGEKAMAFYWLKKNKSNPTTVVDRQEPSKEVSLAQLATQSLSAKAPKL